MVADVHNKGMEFLFDAVILMCFKRCACPWVDASLQYKNRKYEELLCCTDTSPAVFLSWLKFTVQEL